MNKWRGRLIGLSRGSRVLILKGNASVQGCFAYLRLSTAQLTSIGIPHQHSENSTLAHQRLVCVFPPPARAHPAGPRSTNASIGSKRR